MRLPTDRQTLHLSCGHREVSRKPEPKPKPKEYAVSSTTPNQHRPSTCHGVWCRYLPWGQSHLVPIPALGSVVPVCCCSSCCCCCCTRVCVCVCVFITRLALTGRYPTRREWYRRYISKLTVTGRYPTAAAVLVLAYPKCAAALPTSGCKKCLPVVTASSCIILKVVL